MNELTVDTAAPVISDLTVWQAARQQRVFRQLMQAFATPGRVQTIMQGDERALPLVLATLIDAATSLADPQHLLHAEDRQRLGAHSANIETAQFILASGTQALDVTPSLGTLENPEQSAMLILQVESLHTGAALHLQGPGINGQQQMHITGVDPTWWTRRAQWNAGFPLGVDMILVSPVALAALPRTTRLIREGEH